MMQLRRFLAILVLILCLVGCGFFKRDLKSSNEAAQEEGDLLDQPDSTADTGPSRGVEELEKASQQSFDWTTEKEQVVKKSAEAEQRPLPPREPVTTAPPPETTQTFQVPAPGVVSNPPITGPSIEPAPEGKPVADGQAPLTIATQPQAPVSTDPITITAPFKAPVATADFEQMLAKNEASLQQHQDSLQNNTLTLNDNSKQGFLKIEDNAGDNLKKTIGGPDLGKIPGITGKSNQPLNLADVIRPSGLAPADTSPAPLPEPAPTSIPRGFQSQETLTPATLSVQPKQPAGTMPPDLSREAIKSVRLNDPAVPSQPTPTDEQISPPATGNEVATGTSPSPPSAPNETQSPPPDQKVPDAKTLKEQAIKAYKESQFDNAIALFRKYLANYPDEDQEIKWRLAQSLFLNNRWGEAEKEFDELRGSPRPEYRADAILKLGMIEQKRGNPEGARTQWKRVVEAYPQTDAAARASKLLAETP